MFDLIQILLMTLHLAAVNAATGGPILAMWLYARATRRSDDVADGLGRRLLRASLHGLYGGMALGAASALLWWRDHPREVETAFAALPMSRYYFGAAELAFSAACFEAWSALWRRRRRPVLGWVLALAGVTNTVYHFPTLFSILGVLSTRPDAAAGATFRGLLADGEVLARVGHFTLASLAVAGAVLAALATPRRATPDDVATSLKRVKSRGALTALVATLAQWPVGVAVLLALPPASREALLGADAVATPLFGLSLGAVVVLMHKTAAAAFGKTTTRDVRSLLLWLGLTIVLMTAVRHYAREATYPTHRAHAMMGRSPATQDRTSRIANHAPLITDYPRT